MKELGIEPKKKPYVKKIYAPEEAEKTRGMIGNDGIMGSIWIERLKYG